MAEWRKLRTGADQTVSRVDRAVAAVGVGGEDAAGLAVDAAPENEPLDESRRQDQLRLQEEALAEARRELRQAKLARWLRHALTLGLWRK